MIKVLFLLFCFAADDVEIKKLQYTFKHKDKEMKCTVKPNRISGSRFNLFACMSSRAEESESYTRSQRLTEMEPRPISKGKRNTKPRHMCTDEKQKIWSREGQSSDYVNTSSSNMHATVLTDVKVVGEEMKEVVYDYPSQTHCTCTNRHDIYEVFDPDHQCTDSHSGSVSNLSEASYNREEYLKEFYENLRVEMLTYAQPNDDTTATAGCQQIDDPGIDEMHGAVLCDSNAIENDASGNQCKTRNYVTMTKKPVSGSAYENFKSRPDERQDNRSMDFDLFKACKETDV